MKKLDIEFNYLRPSPESMSKVCDELVDGLAACAVSIGGIYAGPSILPNIAGPNSASPVDISDADSWVEQMNDLEYEKRLAILETFPIHQIISGFWAYAIEGEWTNHITRQPIKTFHYVYAFCHLARFSIEHLSFNQVPINIERLYSRARARMIIDIAREPGCDADGICPDTLTIEDVAILAEIAPQSVRNALTAKKDARLPCNRVRGEIIIDPLAAHDWLLGRKKYQATNLSKVKILVKTDKEVSI